MPEDMAQRIASLYVTYDCDIIVDDIGWPEAPYFLEDDLMNTISGYTTTQNKIYISAAGNHGTSGWDGMANVNANDWQYFYVSGGSGDINNYFTLPPDSTITIHLQWANPWHYAFDNYDLHLFNSSGNEVDNSMLVQDGIQDLPPKEKIVFKNTGQFSETYSIRIKKAVSSEFRELKLLLDPTVYPLTYTAPSPTASKQQIFGHPASLNTISVGAYPAQNPSVLESFSSRGPTNVYNFFGGGGYTVDNRETPTIVATDGVETKTGAAGHFDFPFFGTSAAAPHIAGIAALYMEEHPTDSNTDFIYWLTHVASTLGNIGSGGTWNSQSGFGKADAFATLKKERVVLVEVTQLDAQDLPFGQVAVWEGNWVLYNVPTTFVWPENSAQTVRSEQNFKPSTTEKYHDWNELNDVVNHHSFTILPTTSQFTAHFEPANNATLQANVIDLGGQAGAAEFKDPWLIDSLDPNYGTSRNQGMSAPFKTVNYATNNLGTGTSYKGVFLNENPNFLPDRPIYSVRAPQTVDFGGAIGTRNVYLVNWTGASFQYPNASETPVVFTSSGVTVSANLKGSMISNDASAFSNNSQHRLIETKTGTNTIWLHQVYTSAGHVWIEHSSDGGNTWTLGNNGQPLDGSPGGKNPSIAYANDGVNDYNYIGVVWQQPYSSMYKIQGMMFNQYTGSSNVPSPVIEVRTLHTEPSDAYSVDANPNLVLAELAFGPYFVTFERKSTSGSWQPGINWLVGHIEDVGSQLAGPFGSVEDNGIVTGTNASTTNVQMSLYPGSTAIEVNLVRQQGSPGEIYSHFVGLYEQIGGGWDYYQYDDGVISYPANVNFSPSIASLDNGYYSACWIEYADMVFYYLGNSVRYYYGDFVQSCSINRGGGSSNGGFAVWSQNPSSNWSNKSIRFDDGIPVESSISTLSTSGKYIQAGNGAGSDLSNMYVSSFYSFTSPYYFSTSGTLGPLSKTNPEFVAGRGFEISHGDATFSYRFEDLNVDGANMGFVEAPDTTDYGKIEVLNNALVTEPFQINAGSKAGFTERSGFADSAAAVMRLGEDGYIHYTVELIDDATGKVVATVKNVNLTSSNAHALKTVSYSLNLEGLAGKAARIKIALETNLVSVADSSDEAFAQFLQNDRIPIAIRNARKDARRRSNLILTKSYSDKNAARAKSTIEELTMAAAEGVPKTYSLEQNYPNPFNPTATINYQLPNTGHITLKVYDVRGREVATLVDEVKQAGRYSVTFDGGKFASGVYLVRMESGSFRQVRKITLIK
jgi:Subtilase family/Secretion system C-terminal sorting domain